MGTNRREPARREPTSVTPAESAQWYLEQLEAGRVPDREAGLAYLRRYCEEHGIPVAAIREGQGE